LYVREDDDPLAKTPGACGKRVCTPHEAEEPNLILGKNLENSDTGKVCEC
jgi:hypothetical protein